MAIRKLTFPEWVKNPSMTRSRLVGEEEAAKAVYNDKYNKMLLKCAGRINYLLFKNGTTRYVIYVQLPSERTTNLYYDVVVEFTAKDDVKQRINNLNGYHVRFFSNDPNFIYTYAYVYNKNDLIIPELKEKISTKALTDKPKITNPNTMVGYVKSIYFVYLFMTNKGLFNKLNWLNADSIEHMKNFFKRTVIHSDKKILQAQHMNTLEKRKAKGDDTTVSKNSQDGLAQAAKFATNKGIYAKKTEKVVKDMHVTMAKNAKRAKTVKYNHGR